MAEQSTGDAVSVDGVLLPDGYAVSEEAAVTRIRASMARGVRRREQLRLARNDAARKAWLAEQAWKPPAGSDGAA